MARINHSFKPFAPFAGSNPRTALIDQGTDLIGLYHSAEFNRKASPAAPMAFNVAEVAPEQAAIR